MICPFSIGQFSARIHSPQTPGDYGAWALSLAGSIPAFVSVYRVPCVSREKNATIPLL